MYESPLNDLKIRAKEMTRWKVLKIAAGVCVIAPCTKQHSSQSEFSTCSYHSSLRESPSACYDSRAHLVDSSDFHCHFLSSLCIATNCCHLSNGYILLNAASQRERVIRERKRTIYLWDSRRV